MSVLLSLLLAAPSIAAAAPKSVRLYGGPKSEDILRRFVEKNPNLKARLDQAARREEAYLIEVRESDLRDAVRDIRPGDNLRSNLEKTTGQKRREELSALPGMKAAAKPVCHTVVECPIPELAIDAPDAEHLSESVRRLVRPWMVLQQARGTGIVVTPVDGPGDAALTIKLKDLNTAPIVVNVTPRLLGGFKVWLDRPLYLAALYDRERAVVLTR